MDKKRKPPPVWFALPFCLGLITFLAICSIGITHFFNLPWHVPISRFCGILIGIALLAIGFPLMIRALEALTIRRAFGQEIYKPKTESKLITTGIYAYTRNPIGFSSTVLFLGWFFIFRVTFLLILTLLFVGMFSFVAKWEEKELTERFGEEYLQYKKPCRSSSRASDVESGMSRRVLHEAKGGCHDANSR